MSVTQEELDEWEACAKVPDGGCDLSGEVLQRCDVVREFGAIVPALIAEVRRLRESVRAFEECEAADKAVDAAASALVRRENNTIIRELLGPCWNHLWGWELERIGSVVDIIRNRIEKAEDAAHGLATVTRERDAMRAVVEAARPISEWDSTFCYMRSGHVSAVDAVRAALAKLDGGGA
jgi:hypothetical protein